MRTNIVIDDRLMEEARHLTGMMSKRETVDMALRLLKRMKEQESVRFLRGKLRWEGDLDEMRQDAGEAEEEERV